jgi:hypothetical protein
MTPSVDEINSCEWQIVVVVVVIVVVVVVVVVVVLVVLVVFKKTLVTYSVVYRALFYEVHFFISSVLFTG